MTAVGRNALGSITTATICTIVGENAGDAKQTGIL